MEDFKNRLNRLLIFFSEKASHVFNNDIVRIRDFYDTDKLFEELVSLIIWIAKTNCREALTRRPTNNSMNGLVMCQFTDFSSCKLCN